MHKIIEWDVFVILILQHNQPKLLILIYNLEKHLLITFIKGILTQIVISFHGIILKNIFLKTVKSFSALQEVNKQNLSLLHRKKALENPENLLKS